MGLSEENVISSRFKYSGNKSISPRKWQNHSTQKSVSTVYISIGIYLYQKWNFYYHIGSKNLHLLRGITSKHVGGFYSLESVCLFVTKNKFESHKKSIWK